MPSSNFYGWKLLGTFWIVMFLNLAFPAYGPSVLLAAMASPLHFDRQTLGSVFSVYIVLSGLPSPLVAMSVNRFGIRLTLIIGSCLIIAGSVYMALFARTGWEVALGYGVLIGTGVATGAALPAVTGLARWFVRRRALAISILYSAGAIGGFVAAPFLNRVITASGDWRTGWWVLAALSTCAAVIAVIFVRERPEDLGQSPDGIADAADAAATARRAAARPAFVTRDEWTYREAVTSLPYWVIVMVMLGGSGGYSLVLAHGVVHLQDLGHSPAAGAWAIGLVAVGGLIAKVFTATLGDRIDPRYLWAVFVAIFGLGLALAVDARSNFELLVFAICIGIGFGGGLVCLMATLSNYFGMQPFAGLAGLAVAVNTTGSAIAPLVGGRLYDLGYGYASSFYVLAAWCFAASVVLFVMRPPRHHAAPIHPKEMHAASRP